MREALERLNASSITSSSIRFSLTGGPVGCTTKTSAPRTLSWIWNHTSPSLKRERCARPRGTPRKRAIASPRAGWALPVKILSSRPIPSTRFKFLRIRRARRGWLGRKDSNLRIRGPKPRALPLGHAPSGGGSRPGRHGRQLARDVSSGPPPAGPAEPEPPSEGGGSPPPWPPEDGPGGAGACAETCCLYTESTFSSRYCRIWLLSGCAMSLKVPSLRFLLGIDTNRPLGPWMILMSVTTKH